jgi:hypothetical protein
MKAVIFFSSPATWDHGVSYEGALSLLIAALDVKGFDRTYLVVGHGVDGRHGGQLELDETRRVIRYSRSV